MITRRRLCAVRAAGRRASLSVRNPEALGAQPPPETKRLRIARVPDDCDAPQYMAEEMLRGEGISDLQVRDHSRGPRRFTLRSRRVRLT